MSLLLQDINRHIGWPTDINQPAWTNLVTGIAFPVGS